MGQTGPGVLVKNHWIDPTDLIQEKEVSRIETRLLRGLRMQTVRQRVLTVEKIQRWSQCALNKPWPTSNAEVEDYLHDLAAD